jgi:FixJ family two-component response regulator
MASSFLNGLENPYTKKVPLIILTGYADITNAIKSKRLGAADFVSKPYEISELLLSIEKALKTEWSEDMYPLEFSQLKYKDNPRPSGEVLI